MTLEKKTWEPAFDDAKHLKTPFFDDFLLLNMPQPNSYVREQLLNKEHQSIKPSNDSYLAK